MSFQMKQRQDDFDDDVRDDHLIGYARPSEVTEDPELTLFRKRQLLAHWASDLHAVENFPALRTLKTGVTAHIDEIKASLLKLDEMVPPTVRPSVRGFGVPGL